MFNRQIEAVLKVIALSIFADKRVLSEEITTFVESATLLESKLNSAIKITETKLLMWFEINRAELQDKMSLRSAEFKQWFETLLSDFPVMSDKNFITDIIANIANSDQEFHISEKALNVMLDRVFETPASAA